MLESLKRQVYEACMKIPAWGLAIFTWGNVSGIDRDAGLVVIKPSGVEYDDLAPELFPVVDLTTGRVVEGDLNPSSDTPTHLELYRRFPAIGGVTHTHSTWATIYAQAGRGIRPYGTTHADHFGGEIPCTRAMTAEEIRGAYELETGRVICETFETLGIDPMHVPAALVRSHGPFTWGKDPMDSVECAMTLEAVADMAFHTEILASVPALPDMDGVLLHKHFDRKHGPGAYYGQKKP